MNNKFENEKVQRKNSKGPPWYDRTLLENTGLNLCLSIYIKSLVSVFIYTVYLCCLLIKTGWRNISSFLLQKKINILVRIKPTFAVKFWNILSNTDCPKSWNCPGGCPGGGGGSGNRSNWTMHNKNIFVRISHSERNFNGGFGYFINHNGSADLHSLIQTPLSSTHRLCFNQGILCLYFPCR